jgi:hypothetical protein
VEEQLPRFPVDQERATITDRLLSLVEPDLERLLKGSSDVRQKLEAEIKKLEGQQGMVYEDRLARRIPEEFASRKMVEIQERLDGARKELKTLKASGKDDCGCGSISSRPPLMPWHPWSGSFCGS